MEGWWNLACLDINRVFDFLHRYSFKKRQQHCAISQKLSGKWQSYTFLKENVSLSRVFVLHQASCWFRIQSELGKTQRRDDANRQEPKGRAKVWHLLGRLGIHKPNPECILKPAAADGCDMTEKAVGRQSQSRGSRGSVQLGSALLLL